MRSALCSGGRERMRCVLRLIETGWGAPIRLTTHRVGRDQSDENLEMMHKMADNAGKLLIVFCVF